jgi:hypothetical protein
MVELVSRWRHARHVVDGRVTSPAPRRFGNVTACEALLADSTVNKKTERWMFEYDNMEPADLVEPETLMSPGRALSSVGRGAGRSTPLRALPIKQPLLLTSETTVAEAAQLMMEEDARVALIVSGERVLGIVTENDVWRAMTVHFSG